MRAVWLAVALVLDAAVGVAAPEQLPPVAPGPDDGLVLPNGREVSRPLTPVEAPAPEPPEAVPEPVRRVEEVQRQKYVPRGPLGPGWSDHEFLMWWPKAHPLPPLVTGNPSGPPVLGAPGTLVLLGGRALGTPVVSGGRFTLGNPLNEEETVGLELVYFFLGSRNLKAALTGTGNPHALALGLPYTDALTGRQDTFPVVPAGVASGSVYVATTTRVQGAEGSFVANLVDGRAVRLNGLLGYRYFQVNEGLTVQTSRRVGADLNTTYDEFSTSNRFQGGQLGLHADVSVGILFWELTGKIALGQTWEVVRIDGVSRTAGAVVPGGVYAQPSNSGRQARGLFAVVPEGTFKVGLRITESGRLYVGYNFLYLSDAARPGDQLDRTINPTQIAATNPGGFTGPERPRVTWNRSDFWVQGLTFGLETRY